MCSRVCVGMFSCTQVYTSVYIILLTCEYHHVHTPCTHRQVHQLRQLCDVHNHQVHGVWSVLVVLVGTLMVSHPLPFPPSPIVPPPFPPSPIVPPPSCTLTHSGDSNGVLCPILYHTHPPGLCAGCYCCQGCLR